MIKTSVRSWSIGTPCKVYIRESVQLPGTIASAPIRVRDFESKRWVELIAVQLDEGFYNQSTSIFVSCMLAHADNLRDAD